MIWTEGDFAMVLYIDGRAVVCEPVHDWDLEYEWRTEWGDLRRKARDWFGHASTE